ncbi:MAG: sigma-54 dependent transcriptional regulator [Porticoccus sp.]|nr:sigma-54 dependent transcriptional regulator [Porticoccus sp.]
MSNPTRVLVVEDDQTLREALCDTIQYGGYQTIAACNGVEALKHLETEQIDLVISDVQMDEMDGHTLLREVKSTRNELPFVLVTAHGSIENAVKAMREGATDYLLKPFEAEVLLEMVSRLGANNYTYNKGMIAEDPKTIKLCELARRVSVTNATVLISGESGTGKEVMARYIHEHSDRAENPFVALNCAAIPETMLESMLFGYEKGAYTGAYQSRAGKFEQANGGTLLLDEISEMDLALQAKLLRVLQEKEVERLGGNTLIPLDVRVLATTNRNLREEVSSGRFREDLYYRLNVFPIHIPPLRMRPKDIVPLADILLQQYSGGRGLKFSAEAKESLLTHCWKGNVRELENCVQRSAILAVGDEVMADALFFEDALEMGVKTQVEYPESSSKQQLDGDLKAREKQLIVDALEAVNGCRKDAAERLGISPRTLRYKLARLKEQGIAIPAIG